MKRLLWLALCAASVVLAQAPAPRAQTATRQPKLVTVIVVDQFRYDYLLKFRDEYTSGFKRLLERGAVMTNAFHEHIPTYTAVGHSVIGTGSLPSTSGIVGNSWYERETGKTVTSVSDDNTQLLGGPKHAGSSPHRLLTSTVGDELKMSGRMPVKVVGISSKDRAAILTSGHAADGAYWFEGEGFVSSTWYFDKLPGWAQAYDDSHSPLRGNDALEAFAEAAIEGEKLGRNGGTDLLTLSFSENDVIGHAKGPDSPEVKEISLKTDKLVGKFLDFVDKQVGLANTLVVLTADHGVSPTPEAQKARRMPGGRMAMKELVAAVNKALGDKYGEAKWVLNTSDPGIYLDRNLISSSKLDLAEVQDTAARAVRAMPHVARVYTSEDLRRGLVLPDMAGTRALNGHNERRAADVTMVTEPYWFADSSTATHGAPWNYDSHVPVIFMGAQVKAGSYHDRAGVRDIAPTLATLLGVETPSGAAGRVLSEIIAK